jgi:Tol biopolymer transport system component
VRRLVGLLIVSLTLAACGGASPGGRGAIVFERGGDLYAVALDGSPVVRLTNTRVRESRPAASSDGRKLAFVGRGGIWTMNVDGTNRRALTHGADTSPTWTRDGRGIYFVRYATVEFGARCGSIFSVAADGRGLRRVTIAGTSDHEDPAISPDGRRIAFTEWNACEGGTADVRVRVVDASGRPARDLALLPGTRFGAHDDYAAPVWSPNGGRIVFLDGGDLRIAARSGSHVRRLARASLSIWDYDPPAWSPDGTWLAFTNGRGAKGDLYVVHPDGTGLRRVTKTDTDHHSPTWVYGLPRAPG